MFQARFKLFKIFGIPIQLDASWLIIFLLLSFSLSRAYDMVEPFQAWLLGALTAITFFACILLHELGHALAAKRMGIAVRGITLFLFGGVAEIEEPKSAGSEFLMAVAGPLVSVALAAIFWSLHFFANLQGWLGVACWYLAAINTAVLVFNMVPAFPLDGGRVLRSILWGSTGSLNRATYYASMAGQGFAWFLIFAGVLLFVRGLFFPGIWLAIVGLFLNNAAQGSYQQLLVRKALKGERVGRFMTPDPITVQPSVTLRQLLDDYVYRYHHKCFPVTTDGRADGMITTRQIKEYPQDEWDRMTVEQIMCRNMDDISLAPDADALHALERMQRSGMSRLLVVEDGKLIGILSLRDLLKFLHLKLELEGEGSGVKSPALPASTSRSESSVTS